MTKQFERPEVYRPPSEHDAYYLPLTSGCSNNTCAFCRYCGYKLTIRDMEDIKQEIDAMALYVKTGIRIPSVSDMVYMLLHSWDGKKVFLQDGDALIYPFAKLKTILEYLNSKFPGIERLASYSTPNGLLHRTVEELKELKKLKLGIIYVGVESGDDEVLTRICKGATHQEIVDACQKVKEADIDLSVTVILGLGGKDLSQQHALGTAKILTEIDPEYGGALTLTLVPGTPLYDRWKKGEFELITPFESLQELKIIIENSTFTHCFFSSMHASNYLSVRGFLPESKAKMLKQIDTILEKRDPALLRPEYLRGL
jgi:radical SAM superfamily enzyme YgiQ (UPF0313 family)